METELQDALSEVQEAVGELSDLRYGSFSRSTTGEDISEEVIATLKRLEAACTSPT
jgi:centromere-localized protein 2